jgi:acetyl-CoA acetyltransferase
MPETAENVATDFKVSRARTRTRWRCAAQARAAAAQRSGFFDARSCRSRSHRRKGDAVVVAKDEHPRETSLEALGQVEAGGASLTAR